MLDFVFKYPWRFAGFEFDITDKKVKFKDEKIFPIIQVFQEKFKAMTGLEFEIDTKKQDKEKKDIEDPKDKKLVVKEIDSNDNKK